MAQFAVIEQAKKSLKTVQDYIKVGMETTIDVAQDIAESKIGKFNSLIHCFNVAFCYFCVFIFTVPAAGINGLNIYQYRYRYIHLYVLCIYCVQGNICPTFYFCLLLPLMLSG